MVFTDNSWDSGQINRLREDEATESRGLQDDDVVPVLRNLGPCPPDG